jgi:hypothetical protein
VTAARGFRARRSAPANDGIAAATKEAGFDACLRKPADTGTLLALVDSAAKRDD